MSKFAAMTGPQAIAGSLVAVIAVASTIFFGTDLFRKNDTPQAVISSVPALSEAATPPQAAPAPVQAAMAPVLDLLRVEPQGMTTLAGRADPGADIRIIVDGAEVAAVAAGNDGGFAALFDLPASTLPRVLSLRVVTADGIVDGEDQALINPTTQAPSPAPIVVADQPAIDRPPAVVVINKGTVDVVQAPQPRDVAPEVMSSVALDTISYSDVGEVELSGRGGAAGFVRVYLDNKPITSQKITADGLWRTQLPDVDTGVYTLRVDEVDASGRVTSRVETPFKREEQTTVAAASTTPVVTVQPGSTLWAIARDRYGSGTQYVRLFEVNRDRIRNPDLIYPGQVFSIPD